MLRKLTALLLILALVANLVLLGLGKIGAPGFWITLLILAILAKALTWKGKGLA